MAESLRSGLVPTVYSRADLLDRLDSEELDRRKLHRNVADSRSTVYRALEELEKHELATQENGTYQATRFGQLVNKEYQRFIAVIDALRTFNNVVETLPPTDLFDSIILVDAEVDATTKGSPGQPLLTLKTLLIEAEQVRCTSPVWSWYIVDIIAEQLHNNTEITLLEQGAPTRTKIEELLPHNQCHQRTGRTQPPFLLVLVDSPEPAVGVVIFDNVGRPEATIRNDTQAAMKWAESVWRRCLDEP